MDPPNLLAKCSGEPETEAELLERARRLAGHDLTEIARVAGVDRPTDLRRAKGWVGRTLEIVLGASASSRAEPDFSRIGIELKTIPVRRGGQPCESTFVATVPLTSMCKETWSTSVVWRKLSRVLLVPVEADACTPLALRRVGNPILWSPSVEEANILSRDWEDFADLVSRGFVESISAHRGVALQMRPKGRDSRTRRWGLDEAGDPFRTHPRAFYLRASFTAKILRDRYVVDLGPAP